MTNIVLDQINLVCADLDTSISFYRLLGLDIPESDVWRTESGPHHVEVKMPNGFELALDSNALASVYNGGSAQHADAGARNVMSFKVASPEAVDSLCAKLASRGHPVSQAPYNAFWGSRYAIVEDPDGNLVGLMSSPDSALRSGPPAI